MRENFKFCKLTKIAMLIGAAGILGLILIIIFDVKYPNPLFSIGVLASLILTIISLIMFAIKWFLTFKKAISEKDTSTILLLIFIASLTVFIFLR